MNFPFEKSNICLGVLFQQLFEENLLSYFQRDLENNAKLPQIRIYDLRHIIFAYQEEEKIEYQVNHIHEKQD